MQVIVILKDLDMLKQSGTPNHEQLHQQLLMMTLTYMKY